MCKHICITYVHIYSYTCECIIPMCVRNNEISGNALHELICKTTRWHFKNKSNMNVYNKEIKFRNQLLTKTSSQFIYSNLALY